MVSRRQLAALGLDRGAIAWRVHHGNLHRIHRGVYAVGHARLTWKGHAWAGVLAGRGPASHRTAAAVWDLRPVPVGAIEVTTLHGARSTRGLRVHRTATLSPADITRHDGIPVTSPARTLVDLAAVLTSHQLHCAVDTADVLRLLDTRAIDDVLARSDRVRGVRALRAALTALAEHGPAITESPLEDAFLEFLADHGLPRPQTQVWVAGHRVDFIWPGKRLIVETDGAGSHDRPKGRRDDRAKTNALQLAGHTVLRLTWDDLTDETAHTLETALM